MKGRLNPSWWHFKILPSFRTLKFNPISLAVLLFALHYKNSTAALSPVPLCLPLTWAFTSKYWFFFLLVWFAENFSPGLNGLRTFQKPPEWFITIILGRACSRSQIASIAASIELIFSPLQFLYCAIIKLPLSLLSSASSVSLCEMGAERKCSAELGLAQSTSETGKNSPQSNFF